MVMMIVIVVIITIVAMTLIMKIIIMLIIEIVIDGCDQTGKKNMHRGARMLLGLCLLRRLYVLPH